MNLMDRPLLPLLILSGVSVMLFGLGRLVEHVGESHENVW